MTLSQQSKTISWLHAFQSILSAWNEFPLLEIPLFLENSHSSLKAHVEQYLMEAFPETLQGEFIILPYV